MKTSPRVETVVVLSVSPIEADHALLEGAWKDFLNQLLSLPNPPFLILTSRLADEHFWAEALNLGAYDVLAKPFDSKEVGRIFSLAWLCWKNQKEHQRHVGSKTHSNEASSEYK